MMPRYGKPRAKRKPSPKKIQQPKQTKTSYTAKGKQVELSHSATAFAASPVFSQ